MTKRVVVAMSGGVDSSTSAALLKEKGYEVVGLSMQLWDYSKKEDSLASTRGGCCSLEDIYDARRVADTLDIPFYVVNMEEAFSKEVVGYFVKSYLSGETPNPCIKCNEAMKFRLLLKKAKELGADYLATGHYARIEKTGGGYSLLRGVDREKDQSYFLFAVTQAELKNLLFPLGNLTKKEVRGIARRFNLRIAEKKESQEVCFIEDSDYASFVGKDAKVKEGEIINKKGETLGLHKGLFRYTIGQRKGLDIKDGKGPYFVIELDMKNNRLVIGRESELYSTGLVAKDTNWIDSPPRMDETLTAVIRYRHRGVESTVAEKNGMLEVRFFEPEKSVAPGQAVVFYKEERVIGGGWIDRAISEGLCRQ